MFMKKEKDLQVAPDVKVLDQELEISQSEKDDLNNDKEYLQYSAEVVGYSNRETQWDAYHTIVNYLQENDSVLDFGCGRGDFERFYQTEYNRKIDYLGIDMNKQLIDAGLKAYNNEVNLKCIDWNKLNISEKRDWCINIGSNNLRYDADTTKDDLEYLHSTIELMYNRANKGIVILLASDQQPIEGLSSYDPGNLLNWAQKKYGMVAIDHSVSNEVFVLIIYKNEN